MLSFFFFTGGIFIWIIPFLFIGLFIRFFRRFMNPDNDEIPHNEYPPDRVDRSAEKKGKNLESAVFQLAYKLKGRITLSDIVLETGLGLKEAESFIEKMIDGTHVTMEVTDSGIVQYEFPEIIARFNEDNQD